MKNEILIYGEIGEEVQARDVIQQLDGMRDAKVVKARINSDGGSVSQGTAIYKAFKDHPAKIITSIEGGAFSIAGYIAMAGDEREIASNGMLMIHGPRTETRGNAEEHEQNLQMLKAATTSMVGAYAEVTGRSEDEIREMLKSNNWLSAQEAVAQGFATRISEASKLAAKLDVEKFSDIPKQFVKAIRKERTLEMKATIPELKAACPGASSDFILDAYESDKSVAEASANFHKLVAEENAELKAKLKAMEDGEEDDDKKSDPAAELESLKSKISSMEETLGALNAKIDDVGALAKKPGASAVAHVSGDGTGEGKSAKAEWDSKVQEKVSSGVPNAKAVVAVMKENPGLREKMVEEVNA